MRTIQAESATELWRKARLLFESQEKPDVVETREGRAKEQLGVVLSMEDIRQRWVANRTPPISLPFALAEVLWILTGQENAAFLNFFNRQLPSFSGRTATYQGAYGFRLRRRFGFDQLERAYQVLKRNPDTRQVVLQLWDATTDLPDETGTPRSADIPCNVVSMVKIRNQKLVWTQIMRSNDIQLGLPYNLVQFTFLQEVLASWLCIEPGIYTHFSDSLHLYERDWPLDVADSEAALPRNTDKVVGSKEELDPLFSKAYNAVEGAINAECLSEADLRSRWEQCGRGMPQFLVSILQVLFMEIARRRRLAGWMGFHMDGHANPLYETLWNMWVSRTAKNGTE